ncbi:MAG: tRNA pseudouridine(55) synthase TruB [Coxiellaceae bacterium]|nr:tRNA pseudouridine(55) synthase TruB [Coxiellaceae bacterium]|tara:strand:- start:1595 stop:2509 length:915 start_codon:yes stop_codon:yes gene_type:complete
MESGRRLPRDIIDGLLLLNKPTGMSSNRALQITKRLLNAQKAGHTGSLDPLATGLLPICFGQATKFAQFLLDTDKQYQVTLKLGVRTTTSDSEGEVISEKRVPELSEQQLEQSLDYFRGETDQTPSMFSALKYQGKPLYYYARQGLTVPRPTRKITLWSLKLDTFNKDEVTLSLHCSKGTYVRTIVDDWGELLGCGAHVTALHRTSVGGFSESAMMALSDLEDQNQRGVSLRSYLLPVDSLVSHFPRIELTDNQSTAMRYGQVVELLNIPDQEYARLYDSEGFLGVGQLAEGSLIARRLMSKAS